KRSAVLPYTTLSDLIALAGRDGENNGRVTLEITDTGKGIASEHVAHVFEPFYTTKRNGTGLGLAVVARIIETHQGKIEVQSEARSEEHTSELQSREN